MNGHHISARHRENGDCCIRGKEEDSFQKGRGQKKKNKIKKERTATAVILGSSQSLLWTSATWARNSSFVSHCYCPPHGEPARGQQLALLWQPVPRSPPTPGAPHGDHVDMHNLQAVNESRTLV
ncbi:unnamed protein product [Eretmochelys imbricata]